jgi:hypothetical protein
LSAIVALGFTVSGAVDNPFRDRNVVAGAAALLEACRSAGVI